jgi:hypothetical protein
MIAATLARFFTDEPELHQSLMAQANHSMKTGTASMSAMSGSPALLPLDRILENHNAMRYGWS